MIWREKRIGGSKNSRWLRRSARLALFFFFALEPVVSSLHRGCSPDRWSRWLGRTEEDGRHVRNCLRLDIVGVAPNLFCRRGTLGMFIIEHKEPM